jgi:hypothetical protein
MFLFKKVTLFCRRTANRIIRRFKKNNDDFFSDNPYVIF